VISTQKQPGFKKGAILFKMASGKKVVKLKGWPRNGCDGSDTQQYKQRTV